MKFLSKITFMFLALSTIQLNAQNYEVRQKKLEAQKILLKKEINKDKEFNLEQFDYSDNEYKYNLYESNNDDVHIICKKYSEYITFSFESEKKENIINLLETIKNIYY